MAAIDKTPFNSVPAKWANDAEVGPFIRAILRILEQNRVRSGGDVDQVENIEVTVVSANGENRNYRRYEDLITENHDMIMNFLSNKNRTLEKRIDEIGEEVLNKPSTSSVNSILQKLNTIEDGLGSLKRKFSSYENSLSDIENRLSALNRKTLHNDEKLFELLDLVSSQKKLTRSIEQQINELTERYDSGS